jgi:hypothetical protein
VKHSFWVVVNFLSMDVIFFLTLGGAYLAVRFWRPVARLIDTCVAKVGRSALPASGEEVPKFVLIRIAFGAILTWRAIQLLLYLAPADYRDFQILLFAVLNLVTGIALLLGFLCQYTLIYLVAFQWQYGDFMLGTYTLGNYIAAILGVVLLVLNSGRSLSMDGWVIKRFPRLRKPFLYYNGAPNPASITAVKWVALFSFWLVCLYSLSMHLNEPAWRNGSAGPLLLSNNFMSRPYDLMGDLFTGNHWAVFLARLSMWSMLPWYLLLVPCVLIGRLPRFYAIAWGVVFFLASLFALQLSWLPEFELLLWAGIFWSRSGITTPQLSLVLDDRSKLRDRAVRFVRVLDFFDRIKVVSANEDQDWLQSHGISHEQAEADLHGVDERNGRTVSGYGTYVAVTRRVVLLWPAYPMLLVGRWLRLGPLAYGWIARRQQMLSGEHGLPSREQFTRPVETADGDATQLSVTRTLVAHVTFLGVFFLAALPAPSLGYQGLHNPLAETARIYGIGPINVFNATDLRLAENWFTLSLLTGDRESLIPILAEDGSRLEYHASDRVYFGHTAQWRRRHIDQTGCFFDKDQDEMRYLVSIYLNRQELPPGEYQVRYRQYFEPLADPAQITRNEYKRQPRELRCTIDFSVAWP